VKPVASERLLRFGSDDRLFGILTMPAEPVAGRPAVLIPNTGVEHRVGPNRLHVEIARAMAEVGVATLRMDLSGMGDSSLPASLSRSDSVADQRAALDLLQREGIAQRFAAIGLCSGGNDVHLLARDDDRVVAGAFIDHFAYPTTRYRATYVAQRVFVPRRFTNYVKRKFAEARSSSEPFIADQIDYFEQPPRERFAAEIDQFIARNMSLFFLFTGELQNLYNYREQLFDGFPSLRAYAAAELHYLPHADHTFSRVTMRRELIDMLKAWISRVV